MVAQGRLVVATGIVGLVVALAGCAPGPVIPPAGTPTPSASSPSPTATASPTPTSTSPALAITIDSPTDSESVAVPIPMSGTSNTFEASLTIDAIGPGGETLCVRHIMATSGSGTPGTWASELAFPPLGVGSEITLRAYELSAKDGSIINLVEREVNLTADRPRIFFTSPDCGATVARGSTLAVTGRALAFEAHLTLELRNASGTPVVTQQAFSAEGGTESDFTATWRFSRHSPSDCTTSSPTRLARRMAASRTSSRCRFRCSEVVCCGVGQTGE